MAQDYELWVNGFLKPTNYFDKAKTRKTKISRLQINNMFRRSVQMFDWRNLPETISKRNLELLVQSRGYAGIIEHNGKHYVMYGGLGGKLNWNYMPMDFIVANPYLNLSKTYHIYDTDTEKKDVAIIPNDSLYQGMLPIYGFHAELLTEIQLTKRRIIINNRLPKILSAPDNKTKLDLDDLLKDVEDGEIASIFDRSFLANIESIDNSNEGARNLITQVLEMEQYQKASLFNDIGLQLNYNMKRETITSSEAQLGESALLPLPDDMIDMRKIACKEINELFGLNLEVEFSSAWKDLRKSIQVEMDLQSKELDNNQEDVHSNGQEEIIKEEENGKDKAD